MGGGFGSKFGPDAGAPPASSLAKKTGKPVKLLLDRDLELMIAGNRPSAFADVKIAADKDGRVTAWESKVWGSGGMGDVRRAAAALRVRLPQPQHFIAADSHQSRPLPRRGAPRVIRRDA